MERDDRPTFVENLTINYLLFRGERRVKRRAVTLDNFAFNRLRGAPSFCHLLFDRSFNFFSHFIAYEETVKERERERSLTGSSVGNSRDEPTQRAARQTFAGREKSGRFTGNRSSAFLAFSRRSASALSNARPCRLATGFPMASPSRFLTPTLTPTSVSHSRVSRILHTPHPYPRTVP